MIDKAALRAGRPVVQQHRAAARGRRDVFADRSSLGAIAVFATIKSVLRGLDLLLALWRYGKPMLKSRLPMQITVLNDLAHFQEACAIRPGWFHFINLIHATH